MESFPRITFDPKVMGGKPSIRGIRVTIGTIVGMTASGRTSDEILRAYPYLDEEDVREALSYAAHVAGGADRRAGPQAGEGQS